MVREAEAMKLVLGLQGNSMEKGLEKLTVRKNEELDLARRLVSLLA